VDLDIFFPTSVKFSTVTLQSGPLSYHSAPHKAPYTCLLQFTSYVGIEIQDVYFARRLSSSLVVACRHHPPWNHGNAKALVQGQGSATVLTIPSIQRRGSLTDILFWVGMAWPEAIWRFGWGGGPRPQRGFLAEKRVKVEGERCSIRKHLRPSAAALLRPMDWKCIEKQRGSLVEINMLFNLTIKYILIAIASRQSRDAIG